MPAGRIGALVLVGVLASTALCALARNGSAPAADRGVAAVGLVDQDGRRTSLETLRGRLVVLNFVYTGCGRICPVQTEQIARLQRKLPASLRTRVRFLSISVDPLHDSPEALKRFAVLHGADLKDWSFVTGEPAALARLADAFAAQSRDSRGGDHATDLRLLDPEGMVIQRYAGVPVAVDRIAADIGQLARARLALR